MLLRWFDRHQKPKVKMKNQIIKVKSKNICIKNLQIKVRNKVILNKKMKYNKAQIKALLNHLAINQIVHKVCLIRLLKKALTTKMKNMYKVNLNNINQKKDIPSALEWSPKQLYCPKIVAVKWIQTAVQ